MVQQYPVPYKFLGGALSSAGVNFMALSLQLLEQGKLLLAVPLLVPLAGVRMCANEEVLAFSGRENPVGASVLHVMRPAHVFVLAIALFLGSRRSRSRQGRQNSFGRLWACGSSTAQV